MVRIVLSIIVILISTSASSCAAFGKETAPSLYVNLQNFPLYLKRGFNPQDIAQPDLNDGSWLKKAPFSNVIISKLNLPGLPKRTFLSPFGQPEEEFTFVIPFTLSETIDAAASKIPGLFLAGIGDNWEIYLNGKLVNREMHLDGLSSLRIQEHHSERSVFFPLPGNLLKKGENIFTFRIIGDPTDQTVGFQYSAPFYLADYDFIKQKSNETLEMLLIGGYLLVFVYHFLLFAIRRKDIHHLFCGSFSALMGFYYLFRTHNIYYYIPNTLIVVKLEFFCIFLVVPALGAFIETLCLGKTSVITKIYSAAFIFLAFSQLIFPHPYGSDTLIVWQIMAIVTLLHILVNNIIVVFIREVRAEKQRHSLRSTKFPGIKHLLVETYAGNLLIAVSVVISSAIIDIIDSMFYHYSLNLTRYCFYFFIMTISLMLARIYGKLNNAVHAKNMFLANMSHEIRTPMNVIMGMADQIIMDEPPEKIRGKTEQIKQAGYTLISIMNDILDFSMLEARKMIIINREYCFRDLIDEITDIINMKLTDKNIQFITDIDPAIPRILIGDSLRIKQVLFNLLWNAIKFTKQGTIEFCAELKDNGEQLTIVFTISDTGVGIKPKNLNSIFTEFSRLGNWGHLNVEGTGLGLAICKNLCYLMEGTIDVKSEYGKGSTFIVTLPQQQGTDYIAEDFTKEISFIKSATTLKGVRVLIVDDLLSNQQVILGLLKPYEMTIHMATSGQEALKLAKLHTYDLIFMDHLLDDGMDGVETLQALRKLDGYSEAPVVALTANAMTGMREFFLERGFQDYISKPIDRVVLNAVINKHLNKNLPEEKYRERNTEKKELKSVCSMFDNMAGAVRAELAIQQLDLLNHFRWHFENGPATEKIYYEKFCALLENLDVPVPLQKEAVIIAEAGRQGAITEIQRYLPGFYTALSILWQENEDEGRSVGWAGRKDDRLNDTFSRLNMAFNNDDSESVDSVMNELKIYPWSASLNAKARELYFSIYDALMMGERNKAINLLSKRFQNDTIGVNDPDKK